MAKRRRELQFWDSAIMNNRTYQFIYERLVDLAISMFEWENLPDEIDSRFMELCLFGEGMCVFFKDEDLEQFLAIQCMIGAPLNVYRIPTIRTAYASNGYQRHLTDKDSVLIYNNYLHTNSQLGIELYTRRLYEIVRTMDVNIKAQKTPVLLISDENQRLVMKNLYKQYDGNEPFIFGDKKLNLDGVKVLSTQAPYVADKLMQNYTQVWNEALTFLGISNTNVNKKERLISEEISRNMGATVASRYSRLDMRKRACEEINKMFDLNIDVSYKEDIILNDNIDIIGRNGEGVMNE